MANDFDDMPLYDQLTREKADYMSDIWTNYMGTFFQTLISYLSSHGIFIPVLTTAQRGLIQSPQNGQMIYNSSTNAPQIFQNGAWKTFTTS